MGRTNLSRIANLGDKLRCVPNGAGLKSPRLVRTALILLLLPVLVIGATAALAPRVFYDDFPFLVHWVDLLPPYNEHLISDVGGLYLGFAVLIAWTAWTLDRTLIRAVSCAWLLTAAIHLGFHATHLRGFDTGDAIAELTSLAFLVVLPLLALWGVGSAEKPSTAA